MWRLPALRLLMAITVLSFASFFLTLSALPLFATSTGVSAGLAGLVTTIMLLCTVLTQACIPALARRLGPTPVLIAGLVALGAPTPLYLLDQQLWWLLVISGIRGCGFAAITVLFPLVAAAAAPPHRSGEAIGMYGLAIAIPNLILLPAAVALTSAGHFGVVAWLGLSPLLAIPLVVRLARHPTPGAEPRHRDSGSARAVMRIAGITLVLLAVTLAGGALAAYLPIARPTGAVATVALLGFGACAALSRWRAGQLSDRGPALALLLISLGLAIGGMTAVAVGITFVSSAGAALIIVGAAVLGLGYGATQNLTLIVAMRRAGPGQRTVASATWNAAFDSGTAIGAFLVGTVAAGTSAGFGFGLCALLMVAAVIPAVTSSQTGARG